MLYTAEQTQNALNERYQHLLVTFDNHVLTLTLNRPEKKNALNPILFKELVFGLSYAQNEKDVWAVVIASNGDTFCAGADLKSFAGSAEEVVSSIPDPNGEILLGEAFNLVHKPCLARVQGNALAGAFLIVCGCQYVFSVDTATFSLPEVKRGLFPFQVLASLRSLMSERKALDLCIRAASLTAQEAKEVGIVTHISTKENLDSDIQSFLDTLKKLSPTAIRKGMQASAELRTVPEIEHHLYLKNKLNDIVTTKDAAEGIMAFVEKREPRWTGE